MSASDYIRLRIMPIGRYRFALNKMRERAKAKGLDSLVALLDLAIERAAATQQKEIRWTKLRNGMSRARGNAVLLDNKNDRQLTAIYKVVEAALVGDEGDPEVIAAEEFMDGVFFDGVGAITSQPFEIQLSLMDSMMETIDKKFANHVQLLNLERPLTRLGRLIEEFRAELKSEATEDITFDQVQGARNELHEITCKVVAGLFFILREEDEDIIKSRRHILAPLKDQQDRVYEAQRRHRRVTDVNPDTGEEIVDESVDLAEIAEPLPSPMDA